MKENGTGGEQGPSGNRQGKRTVKYTELAALPATHAHKPRQLDPQPRTTRCKERLLLERTRFDITRQRRPPGRRKSCGHTGIIPLRRPECLKYWFVPNFNRHAHAHRHTGTVPCPALAAWAGRSLFSSARKPGQCQTH